MNLNYPVIIDGGLATVLEDLGCNLHHKLWSAKIIDENPQAIIDAHKLYINAGAEIIATASYQASIIGLIENGYSKLEAISAMLKTVELAKRAIEECKNNNPDLKPPLIGASIGPYGAYLADGSEYRGNYGVSKGRLADFHKERLEVFQDTDVDLLLLETFPDKTEVEVVADLLVDSSKPAWVSFACKDEAHLNDGTSVEEAAEMFNDHPAVFALGINCTKPVYISKLLQRLKAVTDKKIVVYPNSNEVYDANSKTWSGSNQSDLYTEMVSNWIQEGADLVGGCCRIGPMHISSIVKQLNKP